jgi:drug/metabolite transporter (DMT)-like permease
MGNQKRFGILTAFLAAILFGASAPVGKPFLSFLNDFQMAGLLYLGAALGVVIVVLKEKSRKWPWQMTRKDTLRLSGAIFFGGILGPLFLLAGLRIAAAASVSLWLNMEMVATVLIGYFFFDDHLSKNGWIASLGTLIAATLLAWGGGVAGFKAGGLIILACICWGIDNHLTALIDGITPAQSTLWKGLVAGSVNLTLGLFISPFTANRLQTLSVLGLGAISYGLSILLYITSAHHLGATRSQLIFSSAPFFGLFLSLLFGEKLTLYQGIAALIYLGSVFLLLKESHTHAHVHQPFIHRHIHYHPDPHHNHKHPSPINEPIRHSHEHEHGPLEHNHPHWPDLHHRHEHAN